MSDGLPIGKIKNRCLSHPRSLADATICYLFSQYLSGPVLRLLNLQCRVQFQSVAAEKKDSQLMECCRVQHCFKNKSIWLVVSTPLKNISLPIYGKITNGPNHQSGIKKLCHNLYDDMTSHDLSITSS